MHVERDIVIAYLSVCLSVTLWYCIKMNAYIVKLLPASGRGATAAIKFREELIQGDV